MNGVLMILKGIILFEADYTEDPHASQGSLYKIRKEGLTSPSKTDVDNPRRARSSENTTKFFRIPQALSHRRQIRTCRPS